MYTLHLFNFPGHRIPVPWNVNKNVFITHEMMQTPGILTYVFIIGTIQKLYVNKEDLINQLMIIQSYEVETLSHFWCALSVHLGLF